MNKKNAFTLVELIAVIAILAVILVMFVPNLLNGINSKKNDALNKVYDIIETAARNYVIDYNISTPTKIELEDLCKTTYIECPIINPNTEEELDGYIFVNNDYIYSEITETPLTVDLNGGETSQTFNDTYEPGTVIELTIPTKVETEFKGWKVVKGNSGIKDNKLVIGTTDTEVEAIYDSNEYTITYDYNLDNLIYDMLDISDSISGQGTYSIDNEVIKITANYEDGYVHTNVKVYLEAGKTYVFNCETSGVWGDVGDTVSAYLMLNDGYDLFYMMDNDNLNEKKYHKFTPTQTGIYYLRLDVNEKGKTHMFSNISVKVNSREDKVKYGETIIVNEPTREGYTFKGWTLSGVGATLTGTSLTIGDDDVMLIANWEKNVYKLTYNSGNLVYDIEDVSDITSGSITYGINNKVISLTSNEAGYVHTNVKVYLEAGKEYTFKCNTTGMLGHYGATVGALLMLNNEYDLYYGMEDNNYTFTPTQTGIYYLRLDVNEKGKTHTFSDISISTNIKVENIIPGSTITLEKPIREGYKFTGWTVSGTSEPIIGSNLIVGNEDIILTANWEV